ncbi:MAG: GTPase [Methanobacteriota archaeon]|nr:MAG: GTPase [Euryarchaeota archaeon]
MKKINVLIMGAAGRDFHNFNTVFRDGPNADLYEVKAFTAEQIPGIDDKKYPAELAGPKYPEGIPIHPAKDLEKLIKELDIDLVVLAYSDLSYEYVMTQSARANAAGADFMLIGPKATMLKSNKPVISICAVRTGCGKSQTTRRVSEILKARGKKVAAIRHPMPYGDLVKMRVQRFATFEDMIEQNCTIEEMEEYEHHIKSGNIVFAGVDYKDILEAAEKEVEIILWDGGNNDFPFYVPDLEIVITDPYRVGHELRYYPGQVNLIRGDVVIINKADSAPPENIEQLKANIRKWNPDAKLIVADSEITVDNSDLVKGKKVLVIEDGPTVTHGEVTTGAGTIAAQRLGCEIIKNPEQFAVRSITETYEKYPHLKGSGILPAMGYGKDQMRDLEETIKNSDAEAVIIGTPIDLTRIINIDRPAARVTYALKEKEGGNLEEIIDEFLKTHNL